jgi:cytochrome b6-f complex iron-sulfur subunit
VHDGTRLFALEAKCTHLGCTPRWYGMEDKFKCPCHGSGFHANGVNFEGPAPRPLDRVKIWQDGAGQIFVDVGKRFLWNERDQPDAFVRVGRAGKEVS